MDPNARSVWIDQYQMDTDVIFHRMTRDGIEEHVVHIDDEFIEKLIASFQALTAAGDRVTILKEHALDGEHYGTVHDVRIDESHGKRWFQTRCSFVPSVWEAYDDQRIIEFSPTFIPELHNPHTGEVHENVLLECSFTAMALQHSLRSPLATNASLLQRAAASLMESPMASNKKAALPQEETEETPEEAALETPDESPEESPEETPEEPTREDLMASLEERDAEIASLRAALAELQPAEEEEGEEEGESEDEEEPESDELAASQARITQLENELILRDLRAAGISADVHQDLISLSRLNPDLYQTTVGMLSASQAGNDVQTPIGRVGDTAVSGVLTPEIVIAEANAAGRGYGNGLTAWVCKQYGEDMALKVSELAKK